MNTPRHPQDRDGEERGLTLDHLPRDGSLGRVSHFAKGTYLWQPDDVADCIYFLQKGVVELPGDGCSRANLQSPAACVRYWIL